ncbi:MAG TPA: 30S ribosomal protein S9, partial [Candidatus Binatus sp.]|nr:30S ribosomal protein S9 [Candidatus Binatus sp.]
MADNATYYYGTGRRKNAVARVRLYPGEGTIMVNNKPPLQYFGRRMLEMVVVEPLKLTETSKRFNVSAMVDGGGMSGQAGAVQHGIARAL